MGSDARGHRWGSPKAPRGGPRTAKRRARGSRPQPAPPTAAQGSMPGAGQGRRATTAGWQGRAPPRPPASLPRPWPRSCSEEMDECLELVLAAVCLPPVHRRCPGAQDAQLCQLRAQIPSEARVERGRGGPLHRPGAGSFRAQRARTPSRLPVLRSVLASLDSLLAHCSAPAGSGFPPERSLLAAGDPAPWLPSARPGGITEGFPGLSRRLRGHSDSRHTGRRSTWVHLLWKFVVPSFLQALDFV